LLLVAKWNRCYFDFFGVFFVFRFWLRLSCQPTDAYCLGLESFMASREELTMIRGARAGQADAQLALGKRYLFGGDGLPQSMTTALHWLDRAARQDCEEAWVLIGTHVPYEIAAQSESRALFARWYERAFDAGVMQAGGVFARLVLAQDGAVVEDVVRRKAVMALEMAAKAGLSDAQWLLAEIVSDAPPADLPVDGNAQAWAERAASSGVAPAQQALAEHAWDAGDRDVFLHWALPLAREIARQHIRNAASEPSRNGMPGLRIEDARLLSRCAQVLALRDERDPDEVQLFWELAAQGGDEIAPFSLGLWLARMDESGARIKARAGAANFKKSVRWLTLAGEQGKAGAWYALSRIYMKPEFSQRSLADALRYLERAAEMGHAAAQLECGVNAWRSRRDNEGNDVRAAFWLQKAAAQGLSDAATLLDKVAPRAKPAPWAQAAQAQLTREMVNGHHFLAARIELAACFGLTRAEALLLDPCAADQGHCLVVDIRENYGRSKRRLVLLQTGEERQVLGRIVRIFENVDCGVNGPEGNYRQRLYRLKTLLPEEGGDMGSDD